ncbi:MAG: hypothetical protein L0211_06630, partial [Planctomycetaceae bacterium]|nr:hypothetical protein [Planctomycetaceae bacterium]
MAAFTAFAIGFPVWYRWPYEQREAFGSVPNQYRSITWQRQWGGGRLRHGPTRTVLGRQLVALQTYCNGVLHGPYEDHWSDGKLHVKGQYEAGQREGVWIEEIQSQVVGRTHWKNGKLDGVSEQFGFGLADNPEQRVLLVFAHGRLVSMDGKPVDDRLATLLGDGTVDDPLLKDVWHRPGASVQGDQTVNCFIANALAEFDIPLRIDLRYVDYDDKLLGNWRELTPAACISATLASGGLTCDYRYGCLWITTQQGLAEWREPTGVSEIHPPAGSLIESAWNEAVTFEAEGEGLSHVLDNLAAKVG